MQPPSAPVEAENRRNPARRVVLTQITNDVGSATISKPPVNPLSSDVCDQLLKSFDEFEQAHVRAVILRADPSTKIWSAGHDIREIPLDGHDAVTWTTGFERVLHRVRSCTVPVIAMLHSSVWGAACDLAVTLIPALKKALAERGRGDIPVVAGGVIPPQDYQQLYADGVAAIFGPGSVISESASKILDVLADPTRKAA